LRSISKEECFAGSPSFFEAEAKTGLVHLERGGGCYSAVTGGRGGARFSIRKKTVGRSGGKGERRGVVIGAPSENPEEVEGGHYLHCFSNEEVKMK